MRADVCVISLLIGYCFGMFLTAEAVARKFAGKSSSEIGTTGNPGMANIMANLGMKPGLLVLAGDLLKCALAVLAAHLLFRDPAGNDVLFAGLGCTLGHDFPVWRKFRGGKGVAASSLAIALYHFPAGLAANIAGMLTVLLTGYLSIGGVVIPAVYALIMAALRDRTAAAAGCVYVVLALYCHRKTLAGIRDGSTKKEDLPGALRKKLRGRRAEKERKEP